MELTRKQKKLIIKIAARLPEETTLKELLQLKTVGEDDPIDKVSFKVKGWYTGICNMSGEGFSERYNLDGLIHCFWNHSGKEKLLGKCIDDDNLDELTQKIINGDAYDPSAEYTFKPSRVVGYEEVMAYLKTIKVEDREYTIDDFKICR